jgi:hypothetical protein
MINLITDKFDIDEKAFPKYTAMFVDKRIKGGIPYCLEINEDQR